MDYTAIAKRSGEWWIGWIQEVLGVTCQERTREELMDHARHHACGNVGDPA